MSDVAHARHLILTRLLDVLKKRGENISDESRDAQSAQRVDEAI
jgi:hypothetical protein